VGVYRDKEEEEIEDEGESEAGNLLLQSTRPTSLLLFASLPPTEPDHHE
jgi:hypothetical protein